MNYSTGAVSLQVGKFMVKQVSYPIYEVRSGRLKVVGYERLDVLAQFSAGSIVSASWMLAGDVAQSAEEALPLPPVQLQLTPTISDSIVPGSVRFVFRGRTYVDRSGGLYHSIDPVMRSAPFYDAVVVTGELPGKGVTCKVRREGEAGQLFAPQVSSPLINVAAAGAERGRNILSDRGEQAAVDVTVPLFAKPLKPGEVGVIMPLDLVEFTGSEGTWHGQCESLRIEVSVEQQAVVIEQTATLERHYTDAD